MKARPLRLPFDPVKMKEHHQKDPREGLSVALRDGNFLWTASDEGSAVERFTVGADGSLSNHQSFAMHDLVTLPRDPEEEEADLEGLAVDDGYLWVAGSHSLARAKPKKNFSDPSAQIARLAKVKEERNRFLLGKIPLRDGIPMRTDGARRSRLLRYSSHDNELHQVLRKDPHLGPFLEIPGKDNGFDIEGLAVRGNRLFLGLRGPVLRGWACVLTVEVEDCGASELHLCSYEKHFLYCDGLGIRELEFDGDDLLLLAGPTMVLDGTLALFRWRGAARRKGESILPREELEFLFEVPRPGGADSTARRGLRSGRNVRRPWISS